MKVVKLRTKETLNIQRILTKILFFKGTYGTTLIISLRTCHSVPYVAYNSAQCRLLCRPNTS